MVNNNISEPKLTADNLHVLKLHGFYVKGDIPVTTSFAIAWIRENFKFQILAPYSYSDGHVYTWSICKIGEEELSDKSNWMSGVDAETIGWSSIEEAENHAIEYFVYHLMKRAYYVKYLPFVSDEPLTKDDISTQPYLFHNGVLHKRLDVLNNKNPNEYTFISPASDDSYGGKHVLISECMLAKPFICSDVINIGDEFYDGYDDYLKGIPMRAREPKPEHFKVLFEISSPWRDEQFNNHLLENEVLRKNDFTLKSSHAKIKNPLHQLSRYGDDTEIIITAYMI